jgi:hypothetical protein
VYWKKNGSIPGTFVCYVTTHFVFSLNEQVGWMEFQKAVLSLGYHTMWVPAGNCFFESIQLFLNNGIGHRCIRQNIVQFIEDNRKEKWVTEAFKWITKDNERKTLNKHLTEMKGGAWATDLEEVAASLLFEKRIFTRVW